MPFGKYAGYALEDIPVDYLRWLLRNVELRSAALREGVEEILGEEASAPSSAGSNPWTKRATGGTTAAPPAALLDLQALSTDLNDAVNRWRRKMAAKHHPDRGGSHDMMVEFNNVVDSLLAAVEEAVKRRAK